LLVKCWNKLTKGTHVLLIWEEFLKIIKEEAGNQIVETWFKAVVLEDWNVSSNTATLRAPNQFVSTWIQEHYLDLLKKHLGRLLHSHDIKFFFFVAAQNEPIARTIVPASIVHHKATLIQLPPTATNTKVFFRHPLSNESNQPATDTKKNIISLPKKPKIKESSTLNPQYRFDTFIVGPSNSLAHAAAVAISKNLGKAYNPLFIYGGTGLGKTHLLHAIGNEVNAQNSSILACYETTDHFINEFINSIRCDKSNQFRNKYQKIDLLLLDDVQFLSNKEQTQETFFHIFNTFYEQKKQIVLSSDTFPKEITGLQNRLKSRMEWGLVADIQLPDLETKIAILKKKAIDNNVDLPDDVADFIASRVLSNIRELEGALIRASAFSSLINQPISLEMARRVLLNINEKQKNNIQLDAILKAVASQYNISVNDLRSKKRQQNIAVVRQVAFYLMKKLTHYSLQAIGNFIGGRDHSTVTYAVTKVETLFNKDRSFAHKIKTIEQKILIN
jgi:chromosomal replication initiator protein